MDMKNRFSKSTDKIEDDAAQKEQQLTEAHKLIDVMRNAVQCIVYREDGKLKTKIYHYDMIADKILEENND